VKRISGSVLLLAAALCLALGKMAAPAAAHMTKNVGAYKFTVG